MNACVRVSVIVSMRGAETSAPCLESLARQSEKSIEILRVDRDPAGPDADPGVFRTLKDAVLQSRGACVLFSDADGVFDPRACSTALKALERKKTSFVEFSSLPYGGGDTRHGISRKGPSRSRRIEGDLLEACFLKKKISCSLPGRAWQGDLCRKAFGLLDGGAVSAEAEALCAGFFLLYSARSCAGVRSALYTPSPDAGSLPRAMLSPAEYRTCCSVLCAGHGRTEAPDAARDRLFRDLYGVLKDRVPPEVQTDALRVLYEAWKRPLYDFVKVLSKYGWNDSAALSALLSGFDEFRFRRREIRTVAFLVLRVHGGGAARVTADIASMLAREDGGNRYRVLLLTLVPPTNTEYEYDSRIRRIDLSEAHERRATDYTVWSDALYGVIDTYRVDLLVTAQWQDFSIVWDILTVKSHPSHPAMIAHTHMLAGKIWSYPDTRFDAIRNIYALLDALVVLSGADRTYWKTINPNVYYIPNRIDSVFNGIPPRTGGPGRNILWVGRISEEKQPLDVPEIMKEVLRRMPDARCTIIGDFHNPVLTEKLRRKIEAEGLRDSVSLQDFHKDIARYYREADLLLFTSRAEGFPLSLMEAAACGLPIVMYDNPGLEFNDLISGYISVPQRHTHEAAEKVVGILSDPQAWLEMSHAATKSYGGFAASDPARLWMTVLRDLETGTGNRTERSVLIEELTYFHRRLLDDMGVKLKKAFAEKARVERSVSYRIGRGITYVPRKLRGTLRCLSKHGFAYTAKKAFSRFLR